MYSQIIDNQNKLLLEKEQKIKALEKELEQAKKVQVVEHFEAYGQCRDSRRIASLETENAELKRDKERLTQAKAIIKQFLNDYPVITKELLDKLEQFVKETSDE